MNDLLGGDYWVDIDQFALRDFDDPNLAQNDLKILIKLLEVGDVFGYNYDIHINKNELFSTYSLIKIELKHFSELTYPIQLFGEMEKCKMADS